FVCSRSLLFGSRWLGNGGLNRNLHCRRFVTAGRRSLDRFCCSLAFRFFLRLFLFFRSYLGGRRLSRTAELQVGKLAEAGHAALTLAGVNLCIYARLAVLTSGSME